MRRPPPVPRGWRAFCSARLLSPGTAREALRLLAELREAAETAGERLYRYWRCKRWPCRKRKESEP